MGIKSTVLRSIETPDGARCVDLFKRPDGTFGFEEYRRDSEDPQGWFVIGQHAGQVHGSSHEALDAAARAIPWLADILKTGRGSD